MKHLVFKAASPEDAKKIVDFWNPYCSHIVSYKGNAPFYVIGYDTEYNILEYRAETGIVDISEPAYTEIPSFMTFPKDLQEMMIGRGSGHSPIPYIKYLCSSNGCGGFDWDSTDEGHEFWSKVIEYQNFDLFYKRFKIKKDESRLFEQESPLRRGSGIVTSGVCCRKHKARVTIKSLGYKEIIGRG